ncbi:TRAP transporter small permease subunit [Stappia indica]|uniref:TRAP transporter small permease protein n=1 Tax=Stappia indica TaxID=538381 RepID=A0A285TM50_9HYPH|nr:TRAP transporter small permease [Stappia indica]SOC23780.1 TRAP-type C4-dicarboxylate transport system, small permease component [Stappia indica]
MLHPIDKAIDGLSRAMMLAACLLVVALILLINVEVVSRYFFNTSTLVADEYGGYALVWICLLGFGQALRSGQFISVDAFSRRFSPLGQRLAAILGALVGLAASLLLTYATYRLVAMNHRFGTVSIQPSATPLWIPQAVLPFGFGLLCLVYLQLLVHAIVGLRRGEGGEP